MAEQYYWSRSHLYYSEHNIELWKPDWRFREAVSLRHLDQCVLLVIDEYERGIVKFPDCARVARGFGWNLYNAKGKIMIEQAPGKLWFDLDDLRVQRNKWRPLWEETLLYLEQLVTL